MTSIRSRLSTLAALLLTAIPAFAQDAKPVRILTNWFAQPDQAGYWQAQQDKLGRSAGVAITVLQGGPKIQTIPQVASGQAEFGIGNADDVLLARLRGTPVKAVSAHLDVVPHDQARPGRLFFPHSQLGKFPPLTSSLTNSPRARPTPPSVRPEPVEGRAEKPASVGAAPYPAPCFTARPATSSG